jgi:hypothetical protein
MTRTTFQVDGELYLSLETVAELYEVKVVWLREAYDSGLLGSGVAKGPTVCIAAIQMDRVASLVRLHVTLGLDLDAIALSLG